MESTYSMNNTASDSMHNLFVYAWSYAQFGNKANIIKAYCLDANSKSYVLDISGYQFDAYIEVPPQYENRINELATEIFRPRDIDAVMTMAEECFAGARKQKKGAEPAPKRKCNISTFMPLRNEIARLNKLYYFNVDSAIFIKCVYSSSWLFKQFIKRMEVPIQLPAGDKIKLKLHEADDFNLTPVIKLLARLKIRPVGWIRAYARKSLEVSHLDYNLQCNVSCIHQCNDISMYPNFCILALDIECVSVDSRTNASVLPNPEKNDDVVFNIGIALYKNKTMTKYLFYLFDKDIDTEAPILDNDGVPIMAVRFETERELIIGLRDFIRRENPQIITGYNVIRFDLDYILKRALLHHAYEDFLALGASGRACSARMDMDEKQTSGKDVLQNIDIDGRIIIDMLDIVKGAAKLDQYTLSAACANYKIPNKDPMTVQEIFMSFISKDAEKMRVVGKYCTQDAYVSLLLFEKLTVLYELLENSSTCQVPPNVYYNRGHQVRFVSQLYSFCKEHGFVLDPSNYSSDIVDYVGAYNLPPKVGLWRNVLAFDFCLTGDTLVSMHNQTSARLDTLCKDSLLFGYNSYGLGSLGVLGVHSSINGLQIKGERDIVHVRLFDGRIIKATPDHKIMLESGEWARAETLEGQYIKCGVGFTEDRRDTDAKWRAKINQHMLDLELNREKSLAFARILGYSFSVYSGTNEYYFDTIIDASTFVLDVKIAADVVGRVNTRIFGTSTVYTVKIPRDFYDLMYNRAGLIMDIIMSENCPVSFIREFLGGLYGGSGVAPRTTISGGIELRCSRLSAPILKSLHARLDVAYETCRYGETSIESEIPIEHVRAFFEKIGFRYSINKSCLLYIVYLHARCVYEEGSSISFHEFINELGVKSWFSMTPVVPAECTSVPTFRQRVIRVCGGYREQVYDIEVDTVHNYVANGAVVSNCSLYPSIMIAHNICFTTLVRDEHDLAGLAPNDYNEYVWEDHLNCEHVNHPDYIKKPTGRRNRKVMICKRNVIRFVKTHVRKGIVPQLVEIFLKRRKEVRKQMETVDPANSELLSILDKRQLSNKVAANAMYGLLGIPKERKGYVSLMEGAAAITYLGRSTIKRVIADVERNFNSTAVYGDSVLGDTALIIKRDGLIYTCSIEELVPEWAWLKYHDKEICELRGTEVWSDRGFTPIRHVIRHRTNKIIKSIQTASGYVDATIDHSLVLPDGREVSPNDVREKDELLHQCTGEAFPDIPCRIEGSWGSLRPYHLGVDVACDSIRSATARVPPEILNASAEEIATFLDGFNTALISLGMRGVRGKLLATGIWMCAKRAKNDAELLVLRRIKDMDGAPVFVIIRQQEQHEQACERLKTCAVVSIRDHIKSARVDHVYDLETENHHFHVGPGDLIVHNTDSCMMVLNDIKDAKPSVELIRRLNERALQVTDHVNKDMIKPMSLAYEGKVYHSMLVLAKKRYFNVLMSALDDTNLKFDINCKGLPLKRRGYCQYMKIVYKYAIEACIHGIPMQEILEKIDDAIDKMFRMQIPYTGYVVTSNVRDKYKATNIAQAKLSAKYETRTGLKLAPNTRVSFVYVDLNDEKAKHSDAAELLDHFIPNRHVLRLGYLDYMQSQFTNAFDQLLSLAFGDRVRMKALGYREVNRKHDSSDLYVQRLYKYRAAYKKVLSELKQRFAPRLVYFNDAAHEAEYNRVRAQYPNAVIELNDPISWINKVFMADDRVFLRLPKPIGGRLFGADIFKILEVVSILNSNTYVLEPENGGKTIRENNISNLKLVKAHTIDIHVKTKKLLIHNKRDAFIRNPRFLDEMKRRKYNLNYHEGGGGSIAQQSASPPTHQI